jgi:hypothetical protein
VPLLIADRRAHRPRTIYDRALKLVWVKETTSGHQPFRVALKPDGKVYYDAPTIDPLDTHTLSMILGPTDLPATGSLEKVAWSADGEPLFGGGIQVKNVPIDEFVFAWVEAVANSSGRTRAKTSAWRPPSLLKRLSCVLTRALTLAAQIDKLKQRFALSHVVLVGDRGMITQARIEEDIELCRILGDGRSGGAVCRRFDDLDAVLESDTSDDFRQLICSI